MKFKYWIITMFLYLLIIGINMVEKYCFNIQYLDLSNILLTIYVTIINIIYIKNIINRRKNNV